jgi:hypothetical protein
MGNGKESSALVVSCSKQQSIRINEDDDLITKIDNLFEKVTTSWQ